MNQITSRVTRESPRPDSAVACMSVHDPQPARRPRFSAVIVTLNEELNIRQCLEHLSWCDERIVIDMQSQDRTRDLAAGLATTILVQEPIPHMEYARNRGIEAATGEWILVVDADECIPEKLADRLRESVETEAELAGIWIPRMNYCFALPVPHVGGFPDYQLRCFRRGAGTYPDRLHSSPNIDGRTVFLAIQDGVWIIHDRKGATIADVVRKFDTYAEKEARMRLQEGQGFAGPIALLWSALSAFRFRFITARGYRDGIVGLVLSVLFAFYRFEVEAKAWELGGYGTRWDRDVTRLRSPGRLVWALAAEGGRQLCKRMRTRRSP